MDDQAPPPPDDPRPSAPPAGWYANPETPGTGQLRYWDGAAWTDHLHDPAPPAPSGSAAPPTWEAASPTWEATASAPYPGGPVAAGTVDPWLWQSIVATFLCCMPFGIAGIVFAARAQGDLGRGDVVAARANADKARLWTLVSVGVAGATLLLFVLVPFLLLA